MKRKHKATTVQGRASAMADKVRDAKIEERATELAALAREKVRDARLDERAQELATLAREKVKDADLDVRAAELAALAREKLASSGVDDVAADLMARARNAAVVQQAAETTTHVAGAARGAADRTLDRVGEWVGDGKVGEALGLRRRRRERPWKLLAAGAAAAGVAAGLVLFRRREAQLPDEWDTAGLDADDRARSTAPGVALPLEGRVREAIGQDPRMAGIGALNINVVDGTVFVRGSVTSDVDQEALRSVIEGVEGVTDVDLQVTVGA